MSKSYNPYFVLQFAHPIFPVGSGQSFFFAIMNVKSLHLEIAESMTPFLMYMYTYICLHTCLNQKKEFKLVTNDHLITYRKY